MFVMNKQSPREDLRYELRQPYLSVVVAARNDDHGGNMLQRMQAFVDAWVGQAKRYHLSSEIVIVEWNPPADRPRLIEALQWPHELPPCEIRFVEVPAEVHRRFPNADMIPLHQMIAKNVGIRRARGEFVLVTNLDIVYSAELMQFFAEQRLESVMYRIDRHDVANNLPGNTSVDELLSFCESHILRVFAGEGDFQLSRNGFRNLESHDIVSHQAGIRFGAGWSPVQELDGERFRWIESDAELFLERSSAISPRLTVAAEVGPSAGTMPITFQVLDTAGSVLAEAKVTGRCDLCLHVPAEMSSTKLLIRAQGSDLPLTRYPRILNLRVLRLDWDHAPESAFPRGQWRLDVVASSSAFDWSRSYYATSPCAPEIANAAYLHTNACGDFTLLSREDWTSLRGYPELPISPMHIDAFFCYAAHHAGIQQSILREPRRIYHIEHLSGAGWTPEGEEVRMARVASKGLFEISYSEFTKWVDLMRRYNAPVIFNGDNWGLGDVSLSERSLAPRP